MKSLQTKNFLLEKDVVLERKALVEEERVRDLTIISSNTQQVPTLTRVVLGDGPSFRRAQAWSPLLCASNPHSCPHLRAAGSHSFEFPFHTFCSSGGSEMQIFHK